MYFRFLIILVLLLICVYYAFLTLYCAGIVKLKKTVKITSKLLIPFYLFFKL